ncbi:MAG TPA: acyltransferase domain-containing protein [Candidatus Polarisedimenticolia bacterium]|nr:acyltransferase domain-containing protein [Candidatus Polarisedimenticolia bacterium]
MRPTQFDNATFDPAGQAADPAAELAFLPSAHPASWSHELFVWRGATLHELAQRIEAFQAPPGAAASSLAHALWRDAAASSGPAALAIVAASIGELNERLPAALRLLRGPGAPAVDPAGIATGVAPDGGAGKIAFLFPGQGSQYPAMLRDLAAAIPEARAAFENAARTLAGQFESPLMGIVFPAGAADRSEEPGAGAGGASHEAQAALTRTDRAQPALGAAGMAVFRALRLAGVDPDMAGGHSYGEYVALCAAGSLDEPALARLSLARGRSILDAARADLGTMAAVAEGHERVAAILAGEPDITLANLNGPRQTVLSGSRAAIERATAILEERGVGVRAIPVGCAFHSPLMVPARDLLAAALDRLRFQAPRFPVYANSTGEPHGSADGAIAAVLKEHLVRPVRFGDEIEAMYRDGARLFVEVGPKNVLTGLVRQILGGRPHLAVACDLPGRPSLASFLFAVGRIWTAGGRVDLEALFRARGLAPAPRPAAVRVPSRAQEEAMAMFQETMRQFLETQRAVMTGFLQGQGMDAGPAATLRHEPRPQVPALSRVSPTPAAPSVPVVPAAPARPAPVKAAPTAVAPPAPVHSAPTPVQAMPAAATPPAPAATRPAPATATPAVAAARPLVDVLLEIAGDRTGYPPEMLGLDANLEADLGIDSIKRVEIIAAFRRAVIPAMGEPPASFMERVTAAKTLRQIVAEVSGLQDLVR